MTRPTDDTGRSGRGEPYRRDAPRGAAPAAMGTAAGARRPDAHLLSFDVEEYFQVEAAAARLPRERWNAWPNRLAPAVEAVLKALADYRAAATFFVVGWVAQHEPQVVRRIAEAGHEIASHGMDHRTLHHFAPDEFRRDLADSRRLLEDLTGRSVVGYRAPTFSIDHTTAWALDVLAEAGFRYDSSVYPVRHDRYGVPDAPVGPHRAVGPGGRSILEIPPMTLRMVGANWPVGGGGYLRLLPVRVVGRALGACARRGRPGVLYVHPWELDPGQPVLPMSRLSRFRHRVGLRRTEAKLRWLLARFAFQPLGRYVDSLAAEPSEAYVYGEG